MPVERVDSLSEARRDDLHGLYRNEWWTADPDRADVDAVLALSDAIVAYADAGTGELVAFARTISDGVYEALVLDLIIAAVAAARG